MVDIFLLKVALSFVVAGVWISGTTFLTEKLGTKAGGLLANLPSNTLVSILFIGLTQNVSFAAETAKAIPLGMIIDTIFLFVFIVLLRKGLIFAFSAALVSWFVSAAIAGFLNYAVLLFTVPALAAVTLFSFYILEYKMHIPSKKSASTKFSPIQMLIRAIFGGGVVAAAVIISNIAGPLWGGIFSVFPAVLLTTMVILTVSQGAQFAQAAGKIMILGSSGITVYGLAVHYLYPISGLIIGTIAAYAATALWTMLMYPLIKKTI